MRHERISAAVKGEWHSTARQQEDCQGRIATYIVGIRMVQRASLAEGLEMGVGASQAAFGRTLDCLFWRSGVFASCRCAVCIAAATNLCLSLRGSGASSPLSACGACLKAVRAGAKAPAF